MVGENITDEIDILEGDTFLSCDRYGNFKTEGAHGLFHRDTRFLSQFVLKIDKHPLQVITARKSDYFAAVVFLCSAKDDGIFEKTLSVMRRKVIDIAFQEEIVIENFAEKQIDLKMILEFDADFADLFEVKSDKPIKKRAVDIKIANDGKALSFIYKRDSFYRETRIEFSQPAKLSKKSAEFRVHIPPKGTWSMSIHIDLITENDARVGRKDCSALQEAKDEMEKALHKWEEDIPKLHASDDRWNHVYKRSCIDLAALRIGGEGADANLPAAGMPWFMALFGRDTLIASYQSLIISSKLAIGTLEALANQQGKEVNDFKDEEPGKILHELRHGELATFGDVPHSPYYGSVDSTMLFIILLSEVYRWTGDISFLEKMRQPLMNCLNWLENFADKDGDGFAEYISKSSKGLANQGWKDSGSAIQFRDGQLAGVPIALCEVQGYMYDAYQRAAELLNILKEPEISKKLTDKAANLKEIFNDKFWISSPGFYALGLDKDKRQIDSLCSNMGQLLWSGIVPQERAAKIVKLLMAKDMYSGWGIRTLSSACAGFNPIAYHRGTVWPHDNSLIAFGLKKYGFIEEAQRIINDILDGAVAFGYRLPETFAGYVRSTRPFPARYPSSCSPQAWASGTPLLMIRILLGLEPDVEKRGLLIDPILRKDDFKLCLDGVKAFGKKYKVIIEGKNYCIEQL